MLNLTSKTRPTQTQPWHL